MQRARAATRPFEHGEAVHYWNKPKDRRQGRWIGPAVVVGREGPNYWVAHGGRCRLTSPEHLRPSGPEESGEFLSMAGVKREVELLLQEDLDDEEVYRSDRNDGEGLGDEDDHMSDYAPSREGAEDEVDDADYDEEGDAVLPDIHEDHGDDEAAIPIELDGLHDRKDEHPRRRMKRKVQHCRDHDDDADEAHETWAREAPGERAQVVRDSGRISPELQGRGGEAVAGALALRCAGTPQRRADRLGQSQHRGGASSWCQMGIQGQKLVAPAIGRASSMEMQVQTRYRGSQRPRFGEGPVVYRLADYFPARTSLFAPGVGEWSP